MNAKIERVCKDINTAKEKINEFQTRLRELEKSKTELENIEIVEAVRGMSISFDELAELLKTARVVPATSGQLGPKSKTAPKSAAAVNDNDDENEKEDGDQ